MDKKRKIAYIGTGIGVSISAITLIILYRNYLYKKAEAEEEQTEKEKYLEDLDSERGYDYMPKRGIGRFRTIHTHGNGHRQKGRLRSSGSIYGHEYGIRGKRFRVSGSASHGEY